MNDIRQRWRDLVRAYALHYDAPANSRHWAPELETCPRDRLREIQGEKLALAYRYLWQCSSFYRRKFEEAGLGPESVRGIDDLRKIPVTHREEWLQDQEENPPWGRTYRTERVNPSSTTGSAPAWAKGEWASSTSPRTPASGAPWR